jgi:drug/metabolite transporter (DMT)-like permease
MANNNRAYLAVVIVCIVWGTTYLANKIGVETIPAMLFASTRQFAACGIIMAYFFLFKKPKNITASYLKRQAFLGFLLITLGNGFGTAALKYLDSGIAAVLATLTPAVIIFFNLFLKIEGKLGKGGILGMILAMTGCVVLLYDDIDFYSSTNGQLGLVLFAICIVSWSYGSLYSRKCISSQSPFFDSAIQMGFGGLFMIPLGLTFEDWSQFEVHTHQLWALAYLVIFGSIITFGAYVYALSKLPATIVSINSYVNPLIALYVGWLILGEKLNLWVILSTVLILSGVYLITRGYVKEAFKGTRPHRV